MATPLVCPGGHHLLSEVHRVRHGERVKRRAGLTQKVDATGSVLLNQPDAAQAAILSVPAAGAPATAADKIPNWVADAYWENTTGSPVSLFTTSWIVPQPPASACGQLIYLFNGMDPANSGDAILQPVLQWGVSPSGGGANIWSIATYYVMGSGPALSTDAVQVYPGDALNSSIRLLASGPDPNTAGQVTFDYIAEFVGYPTTALRASSVNELVWCYETLETYGASSSTNCYPADPKTAMNKITIQTGLPGTAPVSPALVWNPQIDGSNIGQKATIVNSSSTGIGEIDISYR
jgi:hypothetical protein